MRKDSMVFWIMVMMLIATGVSLSATSSQASELDRQLELCNVNRQSGDKVTGVHYHGGSGNRVVFNVALTLDATHLPGEKFTIAILPFDRDGNNIGSYEPVPWPLVRTTIGFTSTPTTLKSGASLSGVDLLLVLIEGVSHKGTFKFCDIFHNANGAWVPGWPPDVPQPEAPPPSQPSGSGWWGTGQPPSPTPPPSEPSGSGWWGTGQPPSPTPPPAPPGQVQLPHDIPQIAGTWRGNNGRTYHLYQFQKGFSWTIEGATEQGTGHFIGKENMQLTVSWQGQFGFGETQGKILEMQGDQATRIGWNNGLVFERQ